MRKASKEKAALKKPRTKKATPAESAPAAKTKRSRLDEIFVHMTPVDLDGNIRGVVVTAVPNMGRRFSLTISKDVVPAELHDKLNCNEAESALEILEAGLQANQIEYEEVQQHADGMYKIVQAVD